jgi:peptide chain release factor 2
VSDLSPQQLLAELDQDLRGIESVLDITNLQAELAQLQSEASDPNLWDDQAKAQAITTRLAHVEGEINSLTSLRKRLDDTTVMLELGVEANDAATLTEVMTEMTAIKTTIDELQVRTLLSGEYDQREALVTIRAEAGGVDAADWAEMVMRMYLRYCERQGWRTEIYDTSYAEEAGIKSATFAVKAPYAYGTLSVEQGTHRLVRISPFDSQNRRHTSFAGVEVVPVVAQSDDIEVAEDDLRIDVYRSSGPGGQGVNTTDSAVRITHLPSGIVVSCQNERSQLQNRATAMAILKAKLLERRRQEERQKLDALRGDSAGSWGTQMRSYVLHPYQMVKDLRTDHEVGNTSAVLDGDIDEFVESAIRWRKKAGS